MNLTALQIQALSRLIQNVATMVELYWDTENGAKLSQSLESFWVAADRITLDQIPRTNSSQGRLVLDAYCPACAFLNDDQQPGSLFNIFLAMEHSSLHGHVVILNGTTERPIPRAPKTLERRVCLETDRMPFRHLHALACLRIPFQSKGRQ